MANDTDRLVMPLLRQIELGKYLVSLRAQTKKSLASVGEALGVSANYLSEIERGLKAPSDNILRKLAEYHNIDENILFEKLGRVPLMGIEELEDSPMLRKLLSEIHTDKRLDENKKEELYQEFYELYKSK